MSDKKTPTIFDVAARAGVARGTVDRVVYNRGGVSKETADRVREAIRELGYTANPIAAGLASRRKFTFACLIPEFSPGDYWDIVGRGFAEGAESFQTHNVSAKMFHFNPDRIESYREACAKVLESRPSGVIMNVVFEDELRRFAQKLTEAGIPYAFVDRKVDDLDYTVYYGADPWDAGYLGAYLLTHRLHVRQIGMIRIQRDPAGQADPNKMRREGFLRYLREHCPDCRIYTTFIPPDNPEQTLRLIEEFCREHPDIKHFTMNNSRIHLMVPFLRRHPDPERVVVGYDDLERNLDAVREGLVEFLVTRRAPMQAFRTLTAFAEFVIYGTPPARRDNYMHMDILGRLNLKDYDL